MEASTAHRETEHGNRSWNSQGRLQITGWDAVRQHWRLILVITLAFVLAGLAAGLVRTPTYKAESRMAVGRLDVSAPGAVASFALATQSLATQYSRAVDAQEVVNPVARKMGLDPLTVAQEISGSPIPDSPVFRIQAESGSEQQAVREANLAARAVIDYTTRLNRSNPDSDRLIQRFNAAVLERNRRDEALDRAKRAAGPNPSPAAQDDLFKAQTRAEEAALKVSTVRQAYIASQQSQASTSLVQQLTSPVKASSDRGKVLQLLLFVGLAAGLLVGTALAMYLTNRRAREALLSQAA